MSLLGRKSSKSTSSSSSSSSSSCSFAKFDEKKDYDSRCKNKSKSGSSKPASVSFCLKKKY